MLELKKIEDSLEEDSASFARESGVLPDGRSFQSELWGEYGYRFITYKIPVAGLELLSKQDIVEYLISQGIKIDVEAYPVEKMQLLTNFNYSDQYDLTIMIEGSDE